MVVGRFAPSPTGSLHIGNLRTSLLAWLSARAEGGRFLLRVEDLDPQPGRNQFVDEQLGDLAALGINHDGAIVRQSTPEVRARHRAAVDQLAAQDLLYPCYCSRREIREAADAAHGTVAGEFYPGTCRELTEAERERRQAERPDRPPAYRVRAEAAEITVEDRLHGPFTGVVDDFVVVRGDGVVAYNVAVVVDDAAQGVTEVVRGDDLLPSTPRQAWLSAALGIAQPEYAHVPLVLGPDRSRLAKRHGSVTLADLSDTGYEPPAVLALISASLELSRPDEDITPADLLERFDLDEIPRDPWILDSPPFVTEAATGLQGLDPVHDEADPDHDPACPQ